jgi:uncharacterized membrane protein YGL010W
MTGFDLQEALTDFDTWHTDPRNRACHDVGLPLITLAVLGALARLPIVGGLDAALVLLGLTFVFDVFVSGWLAPGVLIAGLGLWAVGASMSGAQLGVAFVAGWAFQLVGHRVLEGNAPAFTDNLVHLVVGPRWLVRRWWRALRSVAS